MAQTIIPLGSPLAVKRYSGALLVEFGREEIFTRKWEGKGETSKAPIMKLTDLENAQGDQITFELSMEMYMQPVEGSMTLHGKEADLSFYSDSIYIDLMRGGVNGGGEMSRKRTLYDLRALAKTKQTSWWAQTQTHLKFIYLSGARGTNSDYLFPTTYAGYANNSIIAPDTNHLVYGGTATSKATLTVNDTMTTLPIDRAVAYAKMMGGSMPAYQKIPQMQPSNVDGEDMWLMIMDPYQALNFRRNTTTNEWADVQKAMAAATGKNNEFIKGGMGIWNKTVLHEHPNCIRFTDYGAGSNVEATRALFLGRQAGVVAYGDPGNGDRFKWHEETRDNGDQMIITTGMKWGFKKTVFNGNDFAVMAIDTAAKRP